MSGAAAAAILSFEEIGREDVASTGGKGASLGELLRAGIRVPPGFVVTTAAYQAFLSAADPMGEMVGSMSALEEDDLDAIERASARARAKVTASELPSGLESGLRDACDRLSGAAGFAVRSSATCEDSEDASFAGLQDTYLWVPAQEVAERVRDCWASIYNFESVSYRRRLGLPEEQVSMAVVVQAMVDARCAGVMFSRSPTTGDKSVVIIEGSWGLGSSVVSGEVTPDKFIVNKVTGHVIDREIADKAIRHVRDASGSDIRVEEVPGDLRGTACLEDAQITDLVRIARHCEAHYGACQDMEWAVDPRGGEEGGIYLLQSRPETVWSQRSRETVSKPKDKAFEHVFSVLGRIDTK